MRNTNVIKLAGPVLLTLGLVFAAPAYAQMDGGMMNGGKGAGAMTQMSDMMHDMADHMISLSGTMSHGNLSKTQQKQMSENMRDMAGMMDNMSGMMGKGMMGDTDQMNKMGMMRKQMDGMMK